MRNAATLLERVTLSKAIEGEMHTFEVDLHQTGASFSVYVYDPEEAFDAPPFPFSDLADAKAAFNRCVELIKAESAVPTESAYDFAERVLARLGVY